MIKKSGSVVFGLLLIVIFVTALVPANVLSASLLEQPVLVEHGEVCSSTVFLPLVIVAESSPPPPEFITQVVALTNQQRVQHGCSEVTLETRLYDAAQGHSEDMAFNDFFSHTGSNGSSPWDRIHDQGYWYSTAGENIAAGYSSPESVVNCWMNSPGHRANILNCAFQDIGVGYYYLANDTGSENYHHYWTQVFASP